MTTAPGAKLSLHPPLAPMEASSVDELPKGDCWQYEPKWDGFRCLAFRERDRVALQSKSGKMLTRYFPELVEAVLALEAQRFVLDSEIVVPSGRAFSFDALLQRIHPASSRVRRLAQETPAQLIVFDLLAGSDGASLLGLRLRERRRKLEEFADRYFARAGMVQLSPATTDLRRVKSWLKRVGTGLDGIVAKRLDFAYRSGDRSGMQKIKRQRTADCVVGGFRYGAGKREVGSLLLGLYDADGVLHHVGFTSSLSRQDKKSLTRKLEALVAAPGFTGNRPRAEPVVERALGAMVPARAQARGRGSLRPLHRRQVPAWDQISALAAGQSAAAMPHGAGHVGGRHVGARGRPPARIAHVPEKWTPVFR